MIFNTELFHKKNVLVICFIFVMGPIFATLLNIAQKSSEFSLSGIAICLMLTLLILYSNKLISSSIEFILLKAFTKMKIKYNIIYPFTIDDGLSFKPIVLLMNPETIRDVMPLNLIFDMKDKQSEYTLLKDKFRTILRINTTSDLVSYIIVLGAVNRIFQHNFGIAFLVSFIAVQVQKSLSDGVSWKGLKYIYKKESILKYIYSFPNIEELEAEDYSEYLSTYKGALDIDTVNIMENYLLESLRKNSINLESDKLDHILMKWHEENNNKYVVLYVAGVFNVIKLIGLLSLKTGSSEYLSLYNKHINLMTESYSRSDHEFEFLKPYSDYINGKIDKISIYHNFDSNRKTIFSYRTKLEQSIFVKR